MTALTSFLNRESTKAVREIFQLIGIPALTVIGSVFINQANIIIDNQEEFAAAYAEQERVNIANTVSINKLIRADQLINIKQTATQEALKNNSIVGIEYWNDYDVRYNELFNENKFTNP